MTSLLIILGGLLVVCAFAQIAVFVTDWIYQDDNSWLLIGTALFSIIGFAIQAIVTGVLSATLVSAIPQLLFLMVLWYGGGERYATSNPFKTYWYMTRDSWKESKLVNRLRDVKNNGWNRIKEQFMNGYNRALNKEGEGESDTSVAAA